MRNALRRRRPRLDVQIGVFLLTIVGLGFLSGCGISVSRSDFPAFAEPSKAGGPEVSASRRGVAGYHQDARGRVRDTGTVAPPQKPMQAPQPAPVARRPAGTPPPGMVEIEVAAGETLLAIADRHRVALSTLMRINKLNSISVDPGQRLLVPAPRQRAT